MIECKIAKGMLEATVAGDIKEITVDAAKLIQSIYSGIADPAGRICFRTILIAMLTDPKSPVWSNSSGESTCTKMQFDGSDPEQKAMYEKLAKRAFGLSE